MFYVIISKIVSIEKRKEKGSPDWDFLFHMVGVSGLELEDTLYEKCCFSLIYGDSMDLQLKL